MTTGFSFPLLEQIDTPPDVRRLPETRLPMLAQELREFLIQTVARTGGHFAANLGTVELTIALHYVFNTPEDRLVWDVGHQTYPHKILTGRRARMDTLRRKGGIAGFPKRCESPYDTFGVGHSSTSLSAALGMAIAAERIGSDRRIVAVIGDGAMTAGMAFEALNHIGHLKSNLLVVLNDNEMSISPNVGALSTHLTQLLSSRLFSTVREGGKKVLSHVPPVLEVARRAEEHVKGLLVPEGTLFEELGFHYFGPVDGHDLPTLVSTLRNLRALDGPRLLHVVTRKGKGYQRAEEEPVGYHGVGTFDPACGLKPAQSGGGLTYTQLLGEWLCDMAEQDERLIGITPAMREGSGLVEFSERFPERYFDVAIAEQHAVTLAAGLACDGLKPVVAIYSTFLQRAYDQLIHDVALQNLPVLFAIDRAGLVGPDGPTHAGSFDYSYLRCIPNLVVMAPADENECRQMLYTGFQLNQPAAVRYPRGKGPGVKVEREMRALPVGQGEIRQRGQKIALLAFGAMVTVAEAVAERLDATVVNMRFIKPLDEALIVQMATEHRGLATLEENVVAGGAGSAVSECLARRGIVIPIRHIGLPDRFVEQGERAELLAECGLDAEGVFQQLMEWNKGVDSE
ncbi:MAG TPA: 1-deoxy-D-xylulose-5-phosphate synthase [Candidatus Competibacteraceae bacterium]|nr:1-deoxy-D-xylulose-5-phosphate synthase [Candidatus Competibacteraceae bacterium]HRZ04850.1 1-deoxy-D-xylulose-5-phosphate synthase [Candidatus Competibacteraceae bacterium]HSA45458.1 1-deoxy-D-xylulose-5-phosphate synthase [Candidatus Competibacteraceae bacterium]